MGRVVSAESNSKKLPYAPWLDLVNGLDKIIRSEAIDVDSEHV
jgi:hypothetical protein